MKHTPTFESFLNEATINEAVITSGQNSIDDYLKAISDDLSQAQKEFDLGKSMADKAEKIIDILRNTYGDKIEDYRFSRENSGWYVSLKNININAFGIDPNEVWSDSLQKEVEKLTNKEISGYNNCFNFNNGKKLIKDGYGIGLQIKQ